MFATNVFDNDVLDEWTIPFGNWVKQMVDWTDQNLDWLLKIIEWPFRVLLETFVTNFLAEISWVWICLAVFVVGTLVRNVRIGVTTSLALAGCGLLGQDYWLETSRTIGMILVAVVLCAIIGIPLGVACGRFDSVWNAVRPAMDAMQVVHAFVYMLPVVFFWGIGVVSATMVTMVFAIPPLIRLTNLGIRQVPEDVVEASRAYGAPEWRVLTDVQLPLALPAIMTGLNQTLLMAIAMLGIAAIMGAGGLGLLVFRAVNNLNVALAASAGLALFLVAVVLDRISQRESSDGGNLLSRISRAWANRKTPEVLLEESGVTAPAPSTSEGVPAPVIGTERLGLLIAAGGAVIGLLSVFLPWSKNAGLLSSYARAADEQGLVGESFSGLSASGGSWFGFIVAAMAVWVLGSVAMSLTRPGMGPRWLSTDATVFASAALFVGAIGFLLTRVSSLPSMTDSYANGVGPIVAALGGVICLGGSVYALMGAPFTPRRPLSESIAYGRIFVGGVALAVVVVGALSIWTEDRREREIMTPEIEAEIEALRAEARDNPALGALNAQKVSNLFNSARNTEAVAFKGLTSDGPGLGWPMLAIAVAGLVASLPAAGLFVGSEIGRWRWSVIMGAIGFAGMMIPLGWIASLLRVADPNFVSGAGAFIAGSGAFLLLAANKSVLELFRRRRVFAGDSGPDVNLTEMAPDVHISENLVESATPAGASR